jgi:NADH-quinone oxidoreductase subunit L
MQILISLIPAFPLLGFLILVMAGKYMRRNAISWVAVGSVSISAIIAICAAFIYITNPATGSVNSHLYTWINTGGFSADIAFHFDSLSLVFCFVITFVGALIHIYSVEFMKDDEGFTRFFTYMNLFVASMLILVLADNLLLLYFGWEGVGLCSYLLIGFWHRDPANGYAARKAFIVTRVGDTFMIIGLFLLFLSFNTLNIEQILYMAPREWEPGIITAIAAALLLLGGAVGKSAQLPMQTWLPDAMAGPSPVSALIHAATMVTAGVYLIARMHGIFELAPIVLTLVAAIGAITLLIAGFSAFAQHDLKRVLAYSTISQIGYMFLALGVGAWSAAIFHFMTHAFFKALLFLAAGSVILLLHEEHDMHKMGGLKNRLPVIFITFLIGGAALSALPLITAGFYSKDQILWFVWASESGSKWLWIAGITGAFITSLYTFRMIFLTFFGNVKTEPAHQPGRLMTIPLIILATLSVVGGFIEFPENMIPVHLFSGLMSIVLPGIEIHNHSVPEWVFQVISGLIVISGILVARSLYYKPSSFEAGFHKTALNKFFYSGWGFDRVYNVLFVYPFTWLSELNKNDFIDRFYTLLAGIIKYFNSILSFTQNGRMRWYALGLTAGLVIILALMMTL